MSSIAIPESHKRVICNADPSEVQLLLLSPNLDERVRKILETEPLTATAIYQKHGKELVIFYIEICNEVDGETIEKELQNHLIKIR